MERTLELAEGAANDDPEVGLRAVAALRVLTERLEMLQVERARALGWSTICVSEAPTIISAQFRATYEALATKEQRRRLLPPALRKQLDEMIEKSTTADAVIEHKP